MTNKTIYDLLETGIDLEVGKDVNGNITVCFHGYWVYEYSGYVGIVGRGKTVDESAGDYYRQIKGKALVKLGDKSTRYVML